MKSYTLYLLVERRLLILRCGLNLGPVVIDSVHRIEKQGCDTEEQIFIKQVNAPLSTSTCKIKQNYL